MTDELHTVEYVKPRMKFVWPTGDAGTTESETVAAAVLAQVLTAPKAEAQPKLPPKWRQDARARVAGVTRFRKPLQDLLHRDANEGDTRIIVTDILTEILGYNKYADLTTEYMVRGEFADYGVRIDKQMTAFVEVKRVGLKLTEKHLRQIEMYGVNEGVEWLILTNGIHWKVWHLSGGLPVGIDLVLDVNILSDDRPEELVDGLTYLAKESLRRNELITVWERIAATTPAILLNVIFSEPVMDAVRKELKRQTGRSINVADLARTVRDGVINPAALN